MRLFSAEPTRQEQEAIHALSDTQLAQRQSRQTARKQPPALGDSTNMGVLFAVAVMGAPFCLVMGLLQRDVIFACAAVVWFAIGLVLYRIIGQRAWYWREHWLLAQEHQRRATT